MDALPTDLIEMVLAKMVELGEAGSQEFFGVSGPTLSNWRNKRTAPTLAAAQKVWKVMLDSGLALPAPKLEGIAITEEPPEPVNGTGHVVFLMPMYGDIEPLTFITLVRAMKRYGMEKITIIPMLRTLIDEARNNLVQKFLATGVEWCMFIDSDMIFPCDSGAILKKMGVNYPEPKASRNAITRLMSHPADKRIVGALYQNRRGSFKPAVEIAYRSPAEDARVRGFFDGKTTTDGLEETGWIGYGMVRLHRSVFLEMQEHAKPGGLLAEIAPPVGREADAFGYFGRTPQWRGEDISMSRRCQKIGIKTFCDTGLLLGHQGKMFNLP